MAAFVSVEHGCHSVNHAATAPSACSRAERNNPQLVPPFRGNYNLASPVSVVSNSYLATLAGIVAGIMGNIYGQRRTRTGMRARVCRNAARQSNDISPLCSAIGIEEPPQDLRDKRLEEASQLKICGGAWPTPQNDRLLRAARGEVVDRAPKWMMRQAGRYLPEYMDLMKHTNFFTVCKTPALAAEITLQPYRRYRNLDSLIIFSDILVIPVAMGMPCRMEPGTGPRFDFSIRTPGDLSKLNMTPDVAGELGYVFDAIYWTRQRVTNEVPIIGFSGAPWTLMGYMTEGGASQNFDTAKKWLYLHPEASRKLLGYLRDIIVEYLVGQYDAGAPMLKVFDTNAGQLPPGVYEEFCVQDLKWIAAEVKRRRPSALLAVFPKDADIALFDESDFDVVACSWTTSPARARRDCPNKTLQGNFDPHLLYADADTIRSSAQQMVKAFGVDKYICNLGHGMLPSHPVDGPKVFLDAVDEVKREDAPQPA